MQDGVAKTVEKTTRYLVKKSIVNITTTVKHFRWVPMLPEPAPAPPPPPPPPQAQGPHPKKKFEEANT